MLYSVVNLLWRVAPARALIAWYGFHRSPVHVVSYPKSGRTWLRLLLGKALQEHFGVELASPSDLLEPHRMARTDRRVPSVRFTHDDNPHLKSPDRLERIKTRYRRKDVVLLVRDPRDVVVSSYYQRSRRAALSGEPLFTGSLTEFIRDAEVGIENVVTFLNIWAANRDVPRRFHLIRYEDLMDDAMGQLEGLLDFLGIRAEREVLDVAVRFGSFENMRELEHRGAMASGRLHPGDPSDPMSYKVRVGRVGGFRDELDADDQVYIDELVNDRLDPIFGYGRGSRWPDDAPHRPA